MNNELYQHKRSDTVKWVITFILLAVLFVGMAFGIYFGVKNSNTNVVNDEAQEDVVDDMANIFNTEFEQSEFIALSSSEATVASDNSVSKTITATINPASSISTLSWTLAFADPSSTWATGKDVNDYVELSYPDEENTKVVVLTCKQPFGEQMILTATSNMDSNKTATCTVDYYKRIASYNRSGSSVVFTGNGITDSNVYSFGTFPISIDPRAGAGVHMNYAESYTYGDYTMDNTATVKFYVKASDALKNLYLAASDYVEIVDLSQFYLLEALTGLDIYSVPDGGAKNYLNETNLSTAANALRSFTGDFFTLKIEVTYALSGTEIFYETFTLDTSSLPTGVASVELDTVGVGF